MHVRHQPRQPRESVHQVTPKADGMRRREAQAFQALDRVDGVKKLHEGAATVRTLRKLVPAVQIDDLSKERDLLHPAGHERADLRDDLGQPA